MNSKQKVTGSSAKNQPAKSGDIVKDKKAFDGKLFAAGTAGVLRSHEVIPDEGDYMADPVYQAAHMQFILETGTVAEEYPSAVAAIEAFQTWCETTEWTYSPPIFFVVTGFTISMTMSAPLGMLGVSMTIEPVGDDHAAAIRGAKDHLQAELGKVFKTALEKAKSKMPAKRETDEDEDEEPEYDVETTECHILRVSKDDKGLRYHAMPVSGKWVKYGIPLYKDIASKEGQKLPKESGEYEINWEVEYELKEDGKPRRVISINEG